MRYILVGHLELCRERCPGPTVVGVELEPCQRVLVFVLRLIEQIAIYMPHQVLKGGRDPGAHFAPRRPDRFFERCQALLAIRTTARVAYA